MKMYKCAWCGEPTYTRWQKTFSGSLKSKGKKCPNCGKRCTNGVASSYFAMFLSFAVIISVLIVYFASPKGWLGIWIMLGIILMQFVLQWIYDFFFGQLDKSLRTHYDKPKKSKKKKK